MSGFDQCRYYNAATYIAGVLAQHFGNEMQSGASAAFCAFKDDEPVSVVLLARDPFAGNEQLLARAKRWNDEDADNCGGFRLGNEGYQIIGYPPHVCEIGARLLMHIMLGEAAADHRDKLLEFTGETGHRDKLIVMMTIYDVGVGSVSI